MIISKVSSIVCFGWIWLFSATVLSITSNYNEYLFLHEFYNSTNGQFWNTSNDRLFDDYGIGQVPWIFGDFANNNPCGNHWEGVTCDYCEDDECFITGFNLERHNISGTLPSSFAPLSHLMVLIIGENSIRGTLPSFVGCAYMAVLDFRLNHFVGPWPDDYFSSIPLMNYFGIDDNYNFRSTIPSSLYSLTSLQQLFLQNNDFTGTISHDFGKLESLIFVKLQNNSRLGGNFSSLSQLSRLSSIDIFNCSFTGTLPVPYSNQ